MVADPGFSGSEPMIRLEQVGKTFPDGTVAVQELSLDVMRGELAVLVGPSGCGKTTTLRDALAALLESDSGRIRVGEAGVLSMDGVRQALRSSQDA